VAIETAEVNLEVVRRYLGDRAVRKLTRAMRPTLAEEIRLAAQRYVADEPGDRIRRLKDRAAFAAAMVHIVRIDPDVRRRVMRLLSRPQASSKQHGGRSKQPRRPRKLGARSRAA
jgi:hypothetical protein